MVIKYHISPYPALTEDFLIRVYEAQAPDAIVYEQIVPAPHDLPTTITINGMDKVVHIVRLYAKDSTALLHDYNVEPLTDTVTLFDPIRFKIGDGGEHTPAAGTVNYINPALLGLTDNDYAVFRNNYGYLFPNLHYTNDVVNGGFALIDPDEFNEGEEFLVQPKPKVIQDIINDSVVAKWFGGFIDVNGSVSYIPAHLRNLFRLYANSIYTFTADVPVPIGYAFCFESYGTSAGTGTIRFENAPLVYNGANVSLISLQANGAGCFSYDGVQWNCIYVTGQVQQNAEPQPGQIIAAGTFNVGDVGAGDPQYLITHNKNIIGDYTVLLSIRSNNPATYASNNKLCITWWHSVANKANEFFVSMQEISPEVQNVSVDWTIIKL